MFNQSVFKQFMSHYPTIAAFEVNPFNPILDFETSRLEQVAASEIRVGVIIIFE